MPCHAVPGPGQVDMQGRAGPAGEVGSSAPQGSAVRGAGPTATITVRLLGSERTAGGRGPERGDPHRHDVEPTSHRLIDMVSTGHPTRLATPLRRAPPESDGTEWNQSLGERLALQLLTGGNQSLKLSNGAGQLAALV